MKMEWLQNDHRQSVGSAEDLYLAQVLHTVDRLVAGSH